MNDHDDGPWLQEPKKQTQGSKKVVFRNLNVYGHSITTSFQRTFSSYILLLPSYIQEIFGHRRRTKVTILKGITGAVEPGEMLLVLGRPGSGCTTFLKAISGNCYGVEVQDDSITYQGIPYPMFHKIFPAESLYVAESDEHFPEVTLEETLLFAAKLRASAANVPAASVVEEIAMIFHLEKSLQTPVGNDLIQGLSGGEKRRTTIAEGVMTGAKVQCWDNSTRGLDSSTAMDFVAFLRRSTRALDRTILVSLYQVSEEMYAAFDKVLLLYEGQQIYFGPSSEASGYFERLGFVRPANSTTPDFLTSITNPEERIVKEDCVNSAPFTAEHFSNVWRGSREYDSLQRQLDEKTLNTQKEDSPQVKSVDATHFNTNHQSAYTTSLLNQVSACIARAFQRLRNSLVAVVSNIVGNAVVAAIFGSVFFNLPENTSSFQARAILIYYVTMLNACIPAFEVLTMWAQRPIVTKHKAYGFSHPVAEGLASIVADIPNKVLICLLSNICVYFIANLRRDVGTFLTFWLFSFTVMITMSMLFRSVGSLSRTYEATLAPVTTIIFSFLIYAGLVVPPSYMAPWLGWVRWINPIAYTFEGLMINEFKNRKFPCSVLVPSGPTYNGVARKTCSAIGARPGEHFVEGSLFLDVKYGYQQNNLWRNFGIMLVLMIFFSIVHLTSTEYIQAPRCKGDVLIFRRKDVQSSNSPQDEESVGDGTGRVLVPNGVASHGLPKQGKDRNMFKDLYKQASVFHWQGITHEIRTGGKSRKILDEVDGWVKPGTLTALMGVTGAGKTTLLDALADRQTTGVVCGDIFVDGARREAGFQRKTGYVQQADLHLQTSTVREALTFSALLRQSCTIPREEKISYVDTVLSMLDMDMYADAVVGVPGKGLNIEQRKRLSIGIELAARPELLLFLDEPTSGLDSQTAWSICMLLKKLANHGQAILCTIHQPSSELFQIFDRLLLLHEGKTIYFGEIGTSASTIISYFQKNGASTYSEGENPAVWLLRLAREPPISTADDGDWSTIWRRSPESMEVKGVLQDSVKPNAQPKSRSDDSEYAASYWEQLTLVTYRLFQRYWRDPTYLYSKLALCSSSALLNGFSFWMASNDIQGLSGIIFSCFLLSIIFPTITQQIIPRFHDGCTLFEAREKHSRTYSWPIFVASNVVVESMWMSLAALPTFVCWYYPTGMWRNGDASFSTNERGGLAFLFVWFALMFASSLAQALAAGIKEAQTAVNISQLLFSLVLIFSGVLVSPNNLPHFWKFMYRVSPVTYLVGGLMATGVGNTKIACADIELLKIDLPTDRLIDCGAYMTEYIRTFGGRVLEAQATAECLYCPLADTNLFLQTFGIEVEERWRNLGLLSVYVIFNVGAIFACFWLTRIRK